MGINLYDFRSLFDDQQEEYKFYKTCQKKYGNFEEYFLKSQADQYTKTDWYIISYFAHLSENFIKSFKDELEPSLLRNNKYILTDVKGKTLSFFEGSSTFYTLQLNKTRKLRVRTFPTSWQ